VVKVYLIYKKVIIFCLLIGVVYLMLQVSWSEYEAYKSELENKEEQLISLKEEINKLEDEISAFNDPEKVEQILRKNGYGKEGETIFILKVPESVTPLEETLKKPRVKSIFEHFVDFITGRDENQ